MTATDSQGSGNAEPRALAGEDAGARGEVAARSRGRILHEQAVKAAPAIVASMTDEQRLVMAKVGLDALIDEATGYQNVRAPAALREHAKAIANARKPKRIRLRRTKGWRKPDGVVNVARPTKWGNPYKIPAGQVGTNLLAAQTKAVEQYRHLVATDDAMVASIKRELRGKDLGCWCPNDQPCHADILLAMANS